MALVLKQWYASKTANANGDYVHLVGRAAGLLAWFLSLIGVDPTTEIEIKKNMIISTTSSLAGRTRRVIPMKSVSSAFFAYEKPWKQALFIGILLLPIWFLGVVVGPLYYFLNKKLTVGVLEVSGWPSDFSFKRSIIEGKNIGEDEAYEVIDIIHDLIEAKTAAGASSAAPPSAPRASESMIALCPKCNSKVGLNEMFCESCGFKLK